MAGQLLESELDAVQPDNLIVDANRGRNQSHPPAFTARGTNLDVQGEATLMLD